MMLESWSHSERVLVLAPIGRDAAIASSILGEAGMAAEAVPDLARLVEALDGGAGAAILTEEAAREAGIEAVAAWLDRQPAWSDLPIVVLTHHGGGPERNPGAARLASFLGNATCLERPFHPTTLVSLATAALRGRRRQYEARARIEEVREGEARYRTLFEAIDAGFCIIELLFAADGTPIDYRFLEVNPAFARQSGLTDAVGRRMRELVPEHEQHWFDVYGRVAITGEPTRLENGSAALGRWWDVHAFRVGEPMQRRVAVLFNDISARRQAELALRELNETLERRVAAAIAERKVLADIVEGTDAFVQVADLDYRWLAINRAAADEFERIFGVRPSVGQSMLDILADQPEHQAAVKAAWTPAIEGRPYTAVGEFGDPELARRSYEMRFSVLRNAAGERVGAYQFVYDVTERLREQARLREAEEQLRQSQKLETIGQLTGGVAHDFNNLLMAVIANLDLLHRRVGGDANLLRLVDGAMQGAERGAALTQRLLAFSRRQDLQPQAVHVPVLLEGMRQLLERSVGPMVQLELQDGGESTWPVLVDPNQLELAILNLALNARDAMPNGGVVTLSFDQIEIARSHDLGLDPGGYLRLRVRDTGSGMDEATLKRAIEPFFSTKGVGKGTGLGLSMIHGLAVQSGGALRLSSEVGVGTTAELFLPVTTATPSQNEVQSEASYVGAAPATVLLVDDDALIAMSTSMMLEDLGHRVIEANSGPSALEILKSPADVDVLLTDQAMPGMTGLELARHARKLRPNLPILLATGYAELPEAPAMNLPRLTKPFDQKQLASELARVLRRSS